MSSEPGKRSFAFFDVDDTLINVKSMFSFQEFWYGMFGDGEERPAFEEEMGRLRRENAAWEILNRRYYAYFAGREVSQVQECAYKWFENLEKTVNNLYHTAIVKRLRQHQEEGQEPVFVSGSFPAVLVPSAERLGVKHMLSTTMEVKDGRYTGEILPPQTIGDGKAVALRMFLEDAGVDAADCYAYGDDISDRQMLEAVGHPFAVSGGRGLEAYAREKGWPVLSPR